MIVLQSIDLQKGCAEFSALCGDRAEIDERFQHVIERAREVCVFDLRLRYPDGDVRQHHVQRPAEHTVAVAPSGGTTAEAPAGPVTRTLTNALDMTHAWTLENGLPTYDVRIRNAPENLSKLASYLSLLLTTFGDKMAHLLHLRLAMYEIYANVVEHGRPSQPDSSIEVHLHFGSEHIEGWIQDECLRFDTLAAATMSIPDKMARHHSRGYGITMIRQLLDSVEYEFNDRGNRITFSKRIYR